MALKYIQLNENAAARPVCFSVSALERLTEEFGSMDQWRDALLTDNIKSISKILEIVFQAGEAYCRGMDIDCPPPLKCRPGDLIDVKDVKRIVEEVISAFVSDSERSVETQAKN